MPLEDPSKPERIHEFLRKSLLGQELTNTQFHLFSARSATSKSRQFTKPRILCANNVLLAKSSKYFSDLLSSGVNPIDPSLSELTDVLDARNNIDIDAYGYASDSDLEDDYEAPPIPVTNVKKPKGRSAVRKTSRISVMQQPKDEDEVSQDDSESDSSDIFVMSPEHPRLDEPFSDGTGSSTSALSSETTVQETLGGDDKELHGHGAAARLQFLGSRHILVKDTAFQTYYTLLNYLYTGEVSFLPLTSVVVAGGRPRKSPTSFLEVPRCSAKSMYRLACKVGLDDLRDEAFAHIKNNLSENNILEELSCSFVSRHPKLLEMELDVLYSLLASSPVSTGFPVLAQRIANKELPHGADIIIGIHTRLLRGPFSWVKEPGAPPQSSHSELASTSEPLRDPSILSCWGSWGQTSAAESPPPCEVVRVPPCAVPEPTGNWGSWGGASVAVPPPSCEAVPALPCPVPEPSEVPAEVMDTTVSGKSSCSRKAPGKVRSSRGRITRCD